MRDARRVALPPAVLGNVVADRATAQAYVDGPLVARLKANTALSDLQISIFDVRTHQSEITHALVPGLANRKCALRQNGSPRGKVKQFGGHDYGPIGRRWHVLNNDSGCRCWLLNDRLSMIGTGR